MVDTFRGPIPSPGPRLPWVIVISHIEDGEQERLFHETSEQTAHDDAERNPEQVAHIQHWPKEPILPDMQGLVLNGSAKDGLWITHFSRDELPGSNACQRSKGLRKRTQSETTLIDPTLLPVTIRSLIEGCARKRTEKEQDDRDSSSQDRPGRVSKKGQPSPELTPLVDMLVATDGSIASPHNPSNNH